MFTDEKILPVEYRSLYVKVQIGGHLLRNQHSYFCALVEHNNYVLLVVILYYSIIIYQI